MELDSIEDLYENALMMGNGESLEYRGLSVEKVDWTHPEHTEYAVFNEDDEKVESLTISGYDDVDDLQDYLDEIADYGPENLEDWTSREEDI
ncbi:hypothetical protein KY092_08125 [Natronomonas gomsonensis]|uniref:hypothetical protein n=1 Tax=Natronomonas gomsonensis TaxID=1046043 RepID=UPI0020CA8F24|nr:hypothetical protein [Natronomonas gomsonensis]MCY4730524.1 hypothetical protein [Natronomonas gomsonensis]